MGPSLADFSNHLYTVSFVTILPTPGSYHKLCFLTFLPSIVVPLRSVLENLLTVFSHPRVRLSLNHSYSR